MDSSRRGVLRSLFCPFLAAGIARAIDPMAAANLSGHWILNLNKSRFGKLRQPTRVFLEIDHQEPALVYTGAVTYPDEDSREFGFAGAIDGKEHPAVRSYGEGNTVLKRVDRATITSTFRSHDGMYVEKADTSISADGRTLTRRVTLAAPGRRESWTEVYERKQ